jgi:cytochrome b pre-mRNA-processing protein 3
MALAFLKRLFNRDEGRAALVPLYNRAVGLARDPDWYLQGSVPDTLDGRFDMLSAIVSIILFRLEDEGEPGQVPSVMLTELFIDDMDGQLREDGIGDVVVGKHIGRMLSALGGRLTAYRDVMGHEGDFEDALTRNLYRGNAPAPDALKYTAKRLRSLRTGLASLQLDQLIQGDIGQP